MSDQKTGVLERLAAASLENCLNRISKVSGCAWRLSGVAVAGGTLDDAVGRHEFKNTSAAAVYIHVKGGQPFTSLMFFDAGDIPHISKCFLAEPLTQASAIARFDEVMLLELGNIVLNSVINYLQNALKKSAIPSVPMLLQGGRGQLAAGLAAYIEPLRRFRIITAAVTVSGGERVSRGEVLAVLPEELAAALERE